MTIDPIITIINRVHLLSRLGHTGLKLTSGNKVSETDKWGQTNKFLRQLGDKKTLTIPPAAHAATSAYCPFSLASRLAAVVTNRTPVAPNG